MISAAEPAPTPLEEQVHRLRNLVYEGDPQARDSVRQVLTTLRLLVRRVQLLDLVMSPAELPAQVQPLAGDLRDYAARDPEVAVDLATAVVLGSADEGLVADVLELLRVNPVPAPLDVLPAVRFLIDTGRSAAASSLLRALSPERPRQDEVDPLAPDLTSNKSGVDAGVLKAVIKLCSKIVAEGSPDGETRHLLAWSLLQVGRLEEAAAHLRGLLDEEPSDIGLMWDLVQTMVRLKRPSEALAVLDGVPNSAGDDPALVKYRVELLVAAGRTDEALDILMRALERDHDNFDLIQAHALVVERTEGSEEALALARRALADHPSSPQLKVLTGELLVKTGRANEAVAVLGDVALAGRGGALAARFHAGALLELDRAREALEVVDAALAVTPKEGRLLYQRALVLRALGRPAEALDVMDAAIAAGMSEPSTHATRADVLFDLGRPAEAVELYARLLKDGTPNLAAGLAPDLESRAASLADEQPQSALILLTAIRDAGVLSAYGHGLYAEMLRQGLQLTAAVKEAEAARRRGADVVWMAGTQSQALVSLSRSAEALTVLAEAASSDQDSRFNQMARVNAMLGLEQVSKARALLEEHFPLVAESSSEEEQDAWLTWTVSAWAVIHIDLREFDEARQLIRQQTRLHERRSDWDYWMAYVYNRRQQYDRAIPLLTRLGDEFGDDGQAGWIEMGDALTAAHGGVASEARGAYERVARSTGERPLTWIAQGWARFRLGDLGSAEKLHQQAFSAATDPIFEEVMRSVVVRAVTRGQEDAEALLTRCLDEIASLPDPARIAALVDEGRYVLNLVDADKDLAARLGSALPRLRRALEARPLGR
jgi:tetratricopeptide (TPR) repeat protein